MPWKFDYQNVDLFFVIDTSVPVASGLIEFGSDLSGDLSIDTGERTNDLSTVDSGLRIIDGNI